jgi:FkbM family methyltransferase
MIRRSLEGKQAFFVQIGSHDGLKGDPLRDLIKKNPLWRGIFIEPLEEPFRRLMDNYGHDRRFIFEQLAVSSQVEERLFYYVPYGKSDIPFSEQMGSFSREHIVKHSPSLDKLIVSINVRCEPLSGILMRHAVDHLDLVHIDTEGYDLQVLRQIDFAKYRPAIVLYEHIHLNSVDRDYSQSLLRARGYRIINCGLDTLALRVA